MHLLHVIGRYTVITANSIWPFFLPFLLIISLYISFNTLFRLRKTITGYRRLRFRKMVGPASLSLGAKIGTGAIIGVIGSLNKLAVHGQGFIEGMALWGLLGACFLIPLTYSETLISRVLDKTPVEYIRTYVSGKAAVFYSISLVALYLFGFGGFQFNGIDTVSSIALYRLLGITMTESQRFFFVIIPIILIAGGIVAAKRHNVFIRSLSGMIGYALVSYVLFFIVFLLRTPDHIVPFAAKAIQGMRNPVALALGVPSGFIFGMQRAIQTSEAGLGTSPLASEEGKEVGPKNAALTQVIPTAITVVVSLLITSYIVSYGRDAGIILLPADGVERLKGFFNTTQSVTGYYGLIVLCVFAVLSGITTLLGSYYFLTQAFRQNSDNRNIVVYLMLITAAGTLAVFGFDILFDIVDILLFAVSGLNVCALSLCLMKRPGSLKWDIGV